VLRLQWNALQVGDKVLVHDDADASLRLQPGIVAMVQTAHGSNDLGVRVTEDCWRCDIIAARAGSGLDAAAASPS
jgi:hypothetical protein